VRARASASLALVTSLASCSPSEPPAVDSAQFVVATGESHADRTKWSVSPRSIGRVRIGMATDSIATLLGLSVTDVAPAGRACAYVRPPGLPAGVALLIIRDTVVRIDVDSATALTEEGVGVGDSEVGLLVLYAGNIRVEPHGAAAHTLFVSNPQDSPYLLVFETDGSMVLRYRAGRRSVTQVAEHCG
jgi:hypothetical protein